MCFSKFLEIRPRQSVVVKTFLCEAWRNSSSFTWWHYSRSAKSDARFTFFFVFFFLMWHDADEWVISLAREWLESAKKLASDPYRNDKSGAWHHLRGAVACVLGLRCSGSMAVPWSARNKAWRRLTPALPHCLFRFWVQLWKWKRPSCINFQSSCIIIQLQKTGGKKKERKEGVTSYSGASALQESKCILETGYLYLNNPSASLYSGSSPVFLSDWKRRQKMR